MVSAASWPSLVVLGSEPEKARSGSCQLAPMPKPFSTEPRSERLSRRDRPANAVLQPWAKSWLNVVSAPRFEDSSCSLNSWPPTLAVLVHGTLVLLVVPVPSRAAVETMVNAVPGDSLAFSAPPAGSGTWPAACWPATARTWPVEACTATISAEAVGTAPRTEVAAACTGELIVVVIGFSPLPPPLG